MLSCKKIFALFFAIIVSLSSCMEQRILFTFKNDVNRNFFKEIPGLGTVPYGNYPVTHKATDVEVYISSFSEKFIEKDHLLELTELNNSTRIPFVTYMGVFGYSQDLYLLKYDFVYSMTNENHEKSLSDTVHAVVFFSIKHNKNNNTIGVTPCYFGTVNTDDNLIAFETELSLKKDKDHYFLKPLRKSKKINGVSFIPADFPSNPKTANDKFNIEKIVRLNPNKVGGYKPLIFDIAKIFHDANALQFHYRNTIHLN